jgi:hypothetical protein
MTTQCICWDGKELAFLECASWKNTLTLADLPMPRITLETNIWGKIQAVALSIMDIAERQDKIIDFLEKDTLERAIEFYRGAASAGFLAHDLHFQLVAVTTTHAIGLTVIGNRVMVQVGERHQLVATGKHMTLALMAMHFAQVSASHACAAWELDAGPTETGRSRSEGLRYEPKEGKTDPRDNWNWIRQEFAGSGNFHLPIDQHIYANVVHEGKPLPCAHDNVIGITTRSGRGSGSTRPTS